jgi:hypothetical protein
VLLVHSYATQAPVPVNSNLVGEGIWSFAKIEPRRDCLASRDLAKPENSVLKKYIFSTTSPFLEKGGGRWENVNHKTQNTKHETRNTKE